MLRFADALGIPRVPQVVAPAAAAPVKGVDGDYAVIHAAPFFRYKQWTREGWRALVAALAARGLKIIATGGSGTTERAYLDEIWNEAGTDVQRFDGRLTWPELSSVLARARVYVGPDTSVTHLAAAAGCPTVALFGPTDPRLWGPWPAQGLSEPWRDAADVQRRGNVWLMQNPLPCMPCQLEGCERRLDSYSACLDELLPRRVIAVVEEAIAGR
jgi:heptosyltransferase-3